MTRWRLDLVVLAATLTAAACQSNGGRADAGDDAGDAGDTDSDGDSDSEDAGSDAATDAGDDAGDGGDDTDSGDGICEPVATLVLDLPVTGTTADGFNDLDDYSCTELSEPGPDLAYAWVNEGDTALAVTATLTDLEADLDLFLLLNECDVAACVGHSATQGDESATAIVGPGEQLFVTIDGFLGAEGGFALLLQAEPVELDCDDAIDDDGDSLTDCADGDCLLDAACIQTCEAEGAIDCGDLITATTEGADDAIQVYETYATNFTGPERVYAFTDGAAGTEVEVALGAAPVDLEVLVLSETCSSDAAVLEGPTSAVFAPSPAVSYFVIVDGRNGTSGSFELSLTCREVGCFDDIDNDSDGLTDCTDIDCELDTTCITPCVPLDPDAGCPPEMDGGPACYPLLPDPLAGFCHEPGDAGVGAPCTMPYQCAPKTTCTPADICLKYCDLDDGVPGCDAGDCTSLGSDPLGVCW